MCVLPFCRSSPSPATYVWLLQSLGEAETVSGAYGLDHLRLTPVTRIPRYRLLIRELLKYTPEDHPGMLCVSLTEASMCQYFVFWKKGVTLSVFRKRIMITYGYARLYFLWVKRGNSFDTMHVVHWSLSPWIVQCACQWLCGLGSFKLLADRRNVQRALEAVEELGIYINEKKRQAENARRFIEIDRHLVGGREVSISPTFSSPPFVCCCCCFLCIPCFSSFTRGCAGICLIHCIVHLCLGSTNFLSTWRKSPCMGERW